MTCTQPGCAGSIVDGYCDVCGLAPAHGQTANANANATAGDNATGPASGVASRRGTGRLDHLPVGSARSVATRPTRRLASGSSGSRLGAGLTQVPAVPTIDPRQALMQPAVVAEDKRFCASCQTEVGRPRDGAPGRTKGFCAQCRTAFDFEPKLLPGTLVGGQYEVVGCLAHGGMGWIYLARDRNVNDRWVVLKGLLNSGDPDASRAAVAEKQYLAEVEHPLIVEIYNFVTAADGASYIVMEYVGGRSLNNLLKDRMAANGGAFSPIPVDQAIAYIVEILPAFSYLHSLGLLYCDFKPANLIQVGDGLKLIDLGGVRRADDDHTAIYGTVGFQAPEVPHTGTTVASDVYTIARTLAVLIFEFRGYQGNHQFDLPSADDVPLFADNDSLYRWLQKGTERQPEDRFQTAEEMRQQLLGVFREVVAVASRGAVSQSTPSALFDNPSNVTADLGWADVPRLLVDPNDASAAWLSGVTTDDVVLRLQQLEDAPQVTTAVQIARALARLGVDDSIGADQCASEVLTADPWEWRAVWIHGLAALHRNDHRAAVAAFNTVYGQLPGELAPKLALAVACERVGETAVAAQMYATCARTDAAYVAAGQFGLARVAIADGRADEALAALDRIPATSRAFGEAHRLKAHMLAATTDPAVLGRNLDAAIRQLDNASADSAEQAAVRIAVYRSALTALEQNVALPPSIGDVEPRSVALRAALERAYRDAAAAEPDPDRRVELVDMANHVRPHTLT